MGKVLETLEQRVFAADAPLDVRSLIQVVQLLQLMRETQTGGSSGVRVAMDKEVEDYAG